MVEQQQAKFEWRRYGLPHLIFLIISSAFWLLMGLAGSPTSCPKIDGGIFILIILTLIIANALIPAVFLYMKKAQYWWYVVIVIHALIFLSIYILGASFFTSMATDCTITDSFRYWRNEASPFAILDNQAYLKDSSITLTIQNHDTRSLTIQKIQVGGSTKLLGFTFEPEQARNITMKYETPEYSAGGWDYIEGAVYKLNVTITYITSDGQEKVFEGAKPIVGKYL